MKLIAKTQRELSCTHIRLNGFEMPKVIIEDSELIGVVKKTVGANGQISIGKEHAGKQITAYIVEDKKTYCDEK